MRRARAVGAVLGLLAGALLTLAAGAAASAPADRLSLTVARESGALTITGLGRAALVESSGPTGEPGGRAGFSTTDGTWYHATHLIRRGGTRTAPKLTLGTDDPAGRRIRVSAGANRRLGVARLAFRVSGPGASEVSAVGIGFEARPGERYLGFGERSNAVDQAGNTVENYVGEGPYVPGDYPIIRTQVPSWGLRERPDATYFPMPWLLSSRGFGVLLTNHETSRFRLGSQRPGEWSVEVDAPDLRLRVFAGPEPLDALRRMTDRFGRQPKPFARWQLGPWVQTGHQNVEPTELANIRALLAADAPASAVETHMRYMPCGSALGQEAAEAARTDAFHRLGLAALSYTREAICATYPEPYQRAVAVGAFIRKPDGSPYTFPAFVGSGQTEIGMLDFSNPDAQEIYASILDRAYANGYDGWMEDYGEYVPPDSVAANGMTGAEMHNYYPLLYHRGGYRYARSKSRPIVRFVRSGWTGVHPYAQIVWGGDPSTDWGFDGLASSVTQALTMGLSGISSWASDIGGFFTFTSPPLTEELLIRWIQFGAVSGVMRTKAEGIGVAQDTRPQVWEEPVLGVWRRYAKLRTQLYPYLVRADRAYRKKALPIMRHLALAYPNDPRAVAEDDQFLFGPDLLAAPVTEPGATSRNVYLPLGRWVDFWGSVSYDSGTGGFGLERPSVLQGSRDHAVEAPLEELPLFARSGTILPLLAPEVDTLAGYGAATEVVRLADRNRFLRLLAFPRGRSRAGFFENGRVSSAERRGRSWTLRLASGRERRYEIDGSLATLKRPFEPKRVTVDGRRIETWSYNPDTRAISISMRAKRAVVEVRG